MYLRGVPQGFTVYFKDLRHVFFPLEFTVFFKDLQCAFKMNLRVLWGFLRDLMCTLGLNKVPQEFMVYLRDLHSGYFFPMFHHFILHGCIIQSPCVSSF